MYRLSKLQTSSVDRLIKPIFKYDNASRLLGETCNNSTSQSGIFSSTYSYDRNSNITTLTRTGYPGGMSMPSYPVDDLAMTYDGNRLVKVTDNADEVLVEKTFDFHDGANNSAEYAYNSNGNATRDDNRGLTEITYNAINLPSHIEVGSDAASEAIVDYIYDATGNKLGTRSLISYFSTRPLTTYAIQQPCRAENHDYIGSYEFRNGQLHRVNTPYGYITMGTFIPYRRDYQGNNRNNADYYAYGLPVQGSEVKDPDPYLYGGKEFYSVKGLNLYDFNARTYAPDIARFMQPDPKAGDYHWLSPYSFCGGDPINYVDPDGNVVIFINGFNFGDGGSSKYWGGMDKEIMSKVNDNKAIYYDGALGDYSNIKNSWSSQNRFDAGKKAGLNDAEMIKGELEDGESIKIVAHSMGASYAKGFIAGLNETDKTIIDRIDFELDIAPFQAREQIVQEGVPTFTLQHSSDMIAIPYKVKNANNNIIITQPSPGLFDINSHRITGFISDLTGMMKIIFEELRKSKSN